MGRSKSSAGPSPRQAVVSPTRRPRGWRKRCDDEDDAVCRAGKEQLNRLLADTVTLGDLLVD